MPCKDEFSPQLALVAMASTPCKDEVCWSEDEVSPQLALAQAAKESRHAKQRFEVLCIAFETDLLCKAELIGLSADSVAEVERPVTEARRRTGLLRKKAEPRDTESEGDEEGTLVISDDEPPNTPSLNGSEVWEEWDAEALADLTAASQAAELEEAEAAEREAELEAEAEALKAAEKEAEANAEALMQAEAETTEHIGALLDAIFVAQEAQMAAIGEELHEVLMSGAQHPWQPRAHHHSGAWDWETGERTGPSTDLSDRERAFLRFEQWVSKQAGLTHFERGPRVGTKGVGKGTGDNWRPGFYRGQRWCPGVNGGRAHWRNRGGGFE